MRTGYFILAVCLIGYAAHIYVSFTEYLWGFLLVGIFFFPLGIIHGLGLLAGVW